MIALGYLLTFGWVFLVLGLTLVLKKKTGADDEVSRKIVHICVAFAYIPMYFCFGSTWHLLVPPAVFIVLNTVSYRRGLFAAMERTDESKKSLGTVYYAVSMTVMAALCLVAPRCLPCYAMGVFCMALGDREGQPPHLRTADALRQPQRAGALPAGGADRQRAVRDGPPLLGHARDRPGGDGAGAYKPAGAGQPDAAAGRLPAEHAAHAENGGLRP